MNNDREPFVKIKLIAIQDHTAVLELCVLVAANETYVRRFRMNENTALSVGFDFEFKNDQVKEISDAVRKMITKAKRHEAV